MSRRVANGSFEFDSESVDKCRVQLDCTFTYLHRVYEKGLGDLHVCVHVHVEYTLLYSTLQCVYNVQQPEWYLAIP